PPLRLSGALVRPARGRNACSQQAASPHRARSRGHPRPPRTAPPPRTASELCPRPLRRRGPLARGRSRFPTAARSPFALRSAPHEARPGSTPPSAFPPVRRAPWAGPTQGARHDPRPRSTRPPSPCLLGRDRDLAVRVGRVRQKGIEVLLHPLLRHLERIHQLRAEDLPRPREHLL